MHLHGCGYLQYVEMGIYLRVVATLEGLAGLTRCGVLMTPVQQFDSTCKHAHQRTELPCQSEVVYF